MITHFLLLACRNYSLIQYVVWTQEKQQNLQCDIAVYRSVSPTAFVYGGKSMLGQLHVRIDWKTTLIKRIKTTELLKTQTLGGK